ncbi:DinB family protein [Spongiivirga citrea]|uniref:DinB family protein n=1 Tax=Spongiivirga citrea TaxID=1481457 RepID=A0A6M0CJM2_9FLAO|nr:DinB family protein [Spongiivirga citrea]NER17173.1 DinB family protein [Spongiivirga citrea]
MSLVLEATLQNRKLLYYFLKTIPLEKLNHIPNGFNNNIFWNIAHSVATQQRLVYGLSGKKLLVDDEFVGAYKKGTKPEKDATIDEVEELKKSVFTTIDQTISDFQDGSFTTYEPYDLSTVKMTLKSVEDAMQFNLYHEGLHIGYIMALIKAA